MTCTLTHVYWHAEQRNCWWTAMQQVLRDFLVRLYNCNVRDQKTCLFFFAWRTHENMSPCTGSRVNTNYERIASWGGCQCWTGNPRISETPIAPHCWKQCLNHSAMTSPSKTDWQQLGSITYLLLQRVDCGQERFSTGLLTPGIVV